MTASLAVPETAREAAQQFAGRGWLLEAIDDWATSGTERFLLIVAEPGWGKTALAAWLAGEGPVPADGVEAERLLRVRQLWSAVHFCVARGQGGTVRPDQFSRDLAVQLAGDEGFAGALLDELAPRTVIEQHVGVNYGTVVGNTVERLITTQVDAADIYHRSIRQPLRAMAARDRELKKTILIDALDEALTVTGTTTIVSLVRDSEDLPPGVRFVLTSREDLRIRDAFEDVRRIDLYDRRYSAEAAHDLENYVSRKVGADTAHALTQRADGNFLYARWVLDALQEFEGPEQIELLPPGLNGLYQQFLDRLIPAAVNWSERYEPFLGCLTVATPVAPHVSLPRWLSWSGAMLTSVTRDLTQLVENVADPDEGEPGLRLYHRSVADFLASQTYGDRFGRRMNVFFVDPFDQHHRIAAHYLTLAGTDWADGDAYCMLRLVHHLCARVRSAAGRPTAGMVAQLYEVVLDPRFQAAQFATLGGIHRTLDDLRNTLDIALSRKPRIDVVQALRCIAEFRLLATGESLSRAVFAAASAGDIGLARRKMIHYTAGPNASAAWNDVLKLYLAWEAAQVGAAQDARELIAMTATSLPDASNALLVRIGELLDRNTSSPASFLATYRPADDVPHLTRYYAVAEPLAPEVLQGRLEPVRAGVERLKAAVGDRAAGEWMVNPESLAFDAVDLAHSLREVLAHDEGLVLAEQTVALVRSNPYPRYRDIALSTLASVVLCAPDTHWVRAQLHRIIRSGLDDEGVTFTFELATLLVAECDRRGLEAPDLSQYLRRALATEDPWGTKVRATTAQAASSFRSGESAQAIDRLVAASAISATYSGYGVTAVLNLIDRCYEFGRGDLPDHSLWGAGRDCALPEIAATMAQRVYDPEFRAERIALVERHRQWCREAVPDLAQVQERLTRMPDLDTRTAYRHHVAARWIGSRVSAAERQVASLIPSALFDSAGLDALLTQAIAPSLEQRPDAEIETLAAIVAESFTSGRPWTFGHWR